MSTGGRARTDTVLSHHRILSPRNSLLVHTSLSHCVAYSGQEVAIR
jgi:hypothetical protein